MNLAFYYHIPVGFSDSVISLPGYIGLFLTSLSKNVDKLYLLAHTAEKQEDYLLLEGNIYLIDLGVKTGSLDRGLFPGKTLEKIDKYILDIDVFLVRAPSPLAPAFGKFRKKGVPVFYYIVGNYSDGADQMQAKSLRDFLIRYFLKWNHRQLMQRIRGQRVLVNSPALLEDVFRIVKEVKLVPSSTLTVKDFREEIKPKLNERRIILYTGRLDLSKGLVELTEACGRLISQGYALELHFVGWEDNPSKPVETELLRKAKECNIVDQVVFHGYKKVGSELNEMYRMADIYCIPSYHEGFPRTIWEAMANRLPVVATRVGGISYFLEDGLDALLIEPKSVGSIVQAFTALLNSEELEKKLIKNAFEKAKDNTVDNRAKMLIEYIIESL